MENNTFKRSISERDLFIYELWSKHNLSYKEISNYDLRGDLTRKTISNYVYSRASATAKQRLIVNIADSLRPKLKKNRKIIDYIYDNQPKCRLSESHIRRIITKCIRKKQNLNITKTMIIAIDFDGTIVENKYPAIGELIPGAVDYIRKLYDDGHEIIIWTCRTDKNMMDAATFLKLEGVPFHAINDNLPHNVELYGSNSRKVYAHCYVDDKNIGGFPGWEKTYEWITETERKYQLSKSKES